MSQTHWKKLHNPDYLGAYSLEPGQDMILTIKTVAKEIVKGPDGKSEECIVMRFVEPEKPMIVNATNAKTIEKLYKTPYIEEWKGRKIQLFSDRIKAFGEMVEALRIRNKVPEQVKISTICADCGSNILGVEGKTAEFIAQYTYKKYSKPLCAECAAKLKETATIDTEVEDPFKKGQE